MSIVHYDIHHRVAEEANYVNNKQSSLISQTFCRPKHIHDIKFKQTI